VRFTDGTTPVNITIFRRANDSGAISQNYAAGSSLQVLLQTAAAGCTTSPADANVTYRMQYTRKRCEVCSVVRNRDDGCLRFFVVEDDLDAGARQMRSLGGRKTK